LESKSGSGGAREKLLSERKKICYTDNQKETRKLLEGIKDFGTSNRERKGVKGTWRGGGLLVSGREGTKKASGVTEGHIERWEKEGRSEKLWGR